MILRLAAAVWCVGVAASVTVTVKGNVPAVVGIPESIPEPLRVKPVGRVPIVTVQVYGAVPPVALRAVEGYAPPPTDTDPCGSPPDKVATASWASLSPEVVHPVTKRITARLAIPRTRPDTPLQKNRKARSIAAVLFGLVGLQSERKKRG